MREEAREEAQRARKAKKALQDAQFAEAQKAREAAEAEAQKARELRLAELKEADEQKVEELEKAALMADDYALTHKMSSKSGNPQQKRYHGSGNRENISPNMDDTKRQGKSTENVGLVSKV